MPKNDQIWPKIGIYGLFGPGYAGLFNALLVGRLVVVARGLYLARHLFTLSEVDTLRYKHKYTNNNNDRFRITERPTLFKARPFRQKYFTRARLVTLVTNSMCGWSLLTFPQNIFTKSEQTKGISP